MTIARLGAAAGVGVETVRYYQRRGLLACRRAPARCGATGRRTCAGCASSDARRRPASPRGDRRIAGARPHRRPRRVASWPARAWPRSTPALPSSNRHAPRSNASVRAAPPTARAVPDPGGVRRAINSPPRGDAGARFRQGGAMHNPSPISRSSSATMTRRSPVHGEARLTLSRMRTSRAE